MLAGIDGVLFLFTFSVNSTQENYTNKKNGIKPEVKSCVLLLIASHQSLLAIFR